MKSNYNKTLLLVEDETLIALSEQKELEKYGYNVLIVNTGEKAISIVKEKPDIDLILMDIDLGNGIDGTVAAEQILKEHEIPVVFVSSHTEPEVVKKTEKITSYGYVVKSSGITVLDASIKMAFKLFEVHKKLYLNDIKQNTMMLNITDVISIIDEKGKIRYKSGNPQKQFGWEFGDLEGSDYWDLVHPDDLEKMQLEFFELLETDHLSTTVEFRYKCKDGSFKPVELTATNLIKDPNINGVLVNFHDLTEKKNVENLLRNRESLLLAVTNALPDISLIYNEKGKYVEILPSENSLLFAPSEKLVGKSIYAILPKKTASEIHKVIKDTIEKKEPQVYEYKLDLQAGETWFQARTSPIKGKIAGENTIIWLAHNITKRKQAENEIKRQLLEKEIILKESHHRIKNNFASVEGILYLQSQTNTIPEVTLALEDAVSRVSSMRILYEKLLLTDDFKETSIKGYLDNLIAEITGLFPKNFDLSVKKEIADFQLDPKHMIPIGIIVNELLTNIIKYGFIGRDSGLIEIMLSKNNENVVLTIEDNGIGLPAGFNIDTQKGFGLMLVKMYSEQLEGSFTIENNNCTKSTLKFCI